MDQKAIMIRTTAGKCWLNTVDDEGVRRCSYLGNVGSATAVEAWCASKGIEFHQQRASCGIPNLTKSPHHLARPRS
jgi:hypothetical protein